MFHASLEFILEYFSSSDGVPHGGLGSFAGSFVVFGEDGVSEEVLGGVDEGEGGVFFVIEELDFEGFSFEVDDPAHFAVLSYIKAFLPS